MIWKIQYIRTLCQSKPIKFILIGMVNTAIGYSIFGTCILLHVGPQPSLIVATVLGVIFNFFSIGRYVFGSLSVLQLIKFILIYTFVYLLNVVLLQYFISYGGLRPLAAQLLCIPIIATINYVFCKQFVFRKSNNGTKSEKVA
jgi:putative flippase GtrA